MVKELDEENLTKALNLKEYDLVVVGYSLSSIPDATDILEACNINDDQFLNYIKRLENSKSEDETKKVYDQIQK